MESAVECSGRSGFQKMCQKAAASYGLHGALIVCILICRTGKDSTAADGTRLDAPRRSNTTGGAGGSFSEGAHQRPSGAAAETCWGFKCCSVCVSELVRRGVALSSIEAVLKQPQRGYKLSYLHNYRTAQTKKKKKKARVFPLVSSVWLIIAFMVVTLSA